MDDSQDFATTSGDPMPGSAAPPDGGSLTNVSSDVAEIGARVGAPDAADIADAGDGGDGSDGDGNGSMAAAAKKRRRGSRGGKRRKRPTAADGTVADDSDDDGDDGDGDGDDGDDPDSGADGGDGGDGREAATESESATRARSTPRGGSRQRPADDVELPERIHEGRASVEAATAALVPRAPRIGDTRPAPVPAAPSGPPASTPSTNQRTGSQPKAKAKPSVNAKRTADVASEANSGDAGSPSPKKRKRPPSKPASAKLVATHAAHMELDAEALERRKGRERKGRPVGRYTMCVHVGHGLTQVAVLEGRNLIEHYVSRPADDVGQIHGNVYIGRVQNVLPGMEAAFVDIATPKNAVLYAGDVQYDPEDIVERSADRPRIENILKSRQLILGQVTKNPIGAKGARLTQEVSLPGRFVVLIPNSKTYGISKRLPDDERKRLRAVLDRVREPEHGLIVRTAAEHATEEELRADVMRLNVTWREIERKADVARKQNRAQLLYREPDLAVRVIREEFTAEYRNVIIDDPELYQEVRSYIEVMNPELAERVEFFDPVAEGLPLYERFHVHEQLHKALDRKVWLQSGGSLIIEHTEALTVIDVNTGKNVGSSSLEATVLHNNLEAASEIARQLRLRDIGGIIVIDFIDMEIRANRRKVVEAFTEALARDKTRSQVFDISELGLVEMTRKRIGEGLLQSFAGQCPQCEGRGVTINHVLLD